MQEINININKRLIMWMFLATILSVAMILIATDFIYDNFDLVLQSPVLIKQRF